MFHNYLYHSSVSKPFIQHCSQFASKLGSLGKEGRFVIDIGSNDGGLLSCFEGFRRLGIEPSLNLAEEADSRGIETVNEFWSGAVAKKVRDSYGQADYVTAFNVLGHCDDVHGFLNAVRTVLAPNGLFIVEVPHNKCVLQHIEFDTIYFEHLSYFLVTPLAAAALKAGFYLMRCDELPIHGGSVRLWFGTSHVHNPVNVDTRKIDGQDAFDERTYDGFRAKAGAISSNVKHIVESYHKYGKVVCGFGAAAKGNILLNAAKLTPELIRCVFDDTKAKQGLFTPGTHIPIYPSESISEIKPDVILILAWNFAAEIQRKLTTFKGDYIIPIHDDNARMV
jgi:D-mycarose 3-C-methyltransferase